MIWKLRKPALAALALLSLMAAAAPSERGADIGDSGWQAAPRGAPDRADNYADLALAGEAAPDPGHTLAGFSSISINEPSFAALLALAIIWLLAINWRFRRERKRRERRRGARKNPSAKPALPGA